MLDMDDLRSEQIENFFSSKNPSQVLSQLNSEQINRLFAKLRAHHQELSQLARQDALTQLPNRYYFEMSMKRLLAQALRHHYQVAVLYIDLDGFKQANDQYGHQVGDQVLIEVSNHIRQLIRDEDLIARLGGDEFILVLPRVEHKTNAGRVARKLIDSISTITISDYPDLNISACVGIAIFPLAANTVVELIQCADTALYAAKKQGHSKFAFYTDEVNSEFERYEALFQSLQESVYQEQLPLKYMPVMSLPALEIVGVILRLPEMSELAVSYWETQDSFYVNLMTVYMRQLSQLVAHWYQRGLNQKTFFIMIEVMPSLLMHESVRELIIELIQAYPGLRSQLVLYLMNVSDNKISRHIYEFCQKQHLQYSCSYTDDLITLVYNFRAQIMPTLMNFNINQLFSHNVIEEKDKLFLQSYSQFTQSIHLPLLFTDVDTYAQKQLVTQLGTGLVCGKVFAADLSESELLELI